MPSSLADKCTISFLEQERILILTYHDRIDIEVEDVISLYEASIKHTGGDPYAVLHIGSEFLNVTPEASNEGSKEKYSATMVAQVFLVRNLAQKIMGNFMINFYSPPKPTRVFSNKEKAMAWLRMKMKEVAVKK